MFGREIIIYGAAGLGVAVLIIGVGFFINYKRKEKKILKYKESFEDSFLKNNDIRQTMTDMLAIYKKGALADAIKAGLYYLDHSILRDYDTALGFIERELDDDRIDALHSQCIMTVWRNRQKLYTLPNKEAEKHVD